MVKIAFVLSAIDPLHGAGFTLDLQVLQSLGVKAVGVPTGILPQDPSGVRDAFFFPKQWVEKTYEPLKGIKPSGLKVSVPGNSIGVIRTLLKRVDGPKVLDPIIWAGGRRVARAGTLRELASYFDLITPNIPEAREMLGQDLPPRPLCEALYRQLGVDVLLKGGHSQDKTDYLCTSGGVLLLKPDEIFPYEVHGTGCLLSSAILAFLLRGRTLVGAVREAKAYLVEQYRRAIPLGPGKRVFHLS